MANSKQPKVLLFDIGGVCVVSPMQAILDYEISHSIPLGWVNHSISRTSPHGFWHRLERGELPMDAKWFAGFSDDLHNPSLWRNFYLEKARKADPSLGEEVPSVPKVDAEYLFWQMMSHSRDFDPWMYPALQNLKKSGKYVLAALSNTVIFPEGHPYANPPPEKDIRRLFDVFVSSAHVGLRKPSPEIYNHTLTTLRTFASSYASTPRGLANNWASGIQPNDIVFLDDIGENLKAGKALGFRTIKVHLGRAFEAVDQLEDMTGLQLAGNAERKAITPKIGKAKL
ncbi:related to epoxide hydrolase [Rhynchosporium secalis]|uniref:Related to epoxide hydrolase n=1 Tax=Rhynchosporium secalis TaxID=38038 RepID=A0A1E1LY08_RHYSE|nr:related to epoxide hydrolase [Rhynchosporium secalis]